MRRLISSLAAVGIICVAVTAAEARIIRVPEDVPSIGQAIDRFGSYGTEIVVAPGTYDDPITIVGRDITVRSTDPEDPAVVAATILDIGGQPSSVVNLWDTRSALKGFTIKGASRRGMGVYGAIYCRGGSPEISHNVIFGNDTTGIGCKYGSEAHIHHNTIISNRGVGISCSESTPTIEYNKIENNSGAGIDLRNCQAETDPETRESSWSISHNVITNNRATEGGGIRCEESNPVISFNTLVYNQADSGAGIYLSSSLYPPLHIHHCIIYSGGGSGGGIYVAAGTRVEVSHCDVYGSSGPNYIGIANLTGSEGNIAANPMLARPLRRSTGGDYHLMSKVGYWDSATESWKTSYTDSPCIDAGAPALGARDEPHPNGGIVNLGAYGGTPEASKTPLRMKVRPRRIRIGPRIPGLPRP